MLTSTIVSMIMLGLIVGLLSGFFGIGGGVIIVPIIAMYYDFQLAVCVSLGVMVLSSGVTVVSKSLHSKILWSWVIKLLPGMIVGVIVGSITHHLIHGDSLKAVLYVVMIIVGIKLLCVEKSTKKIMMQPRSHYIGIYGGLLGFLSGMLGIGVGSFCLPYLVYYRVTVQQASAIVSICTFIVSIIGFAIVGSHLSELSKADNIVFWPMLLAIGLSSCVASPLATRFSKNLDTILLQKSFAVLLIVFAISMLAKYILMLNL